MTRRQFLGGLAATFATTMLPVLALAPSAEPDLFDDVPLYMTGKHGLYRIYRGRVVLIGVEPDPEITTRTIGICHHSWNFKTPGS